jgi:hypothetical protein
MTRHEDAWHLTLKQSCWVALAIGVLIYLQDWSGYSKREPDLFFPKPIREVWWHLPFWVGVSFGVLQMLRLMDWTKERPVPYWIAYVVVLIGAVGLTVWIFLRFS